MMRPPIKPAAMAALPADVCCNCLSVFTTDDVEEVEGSFVDEGVFDVPDDRTLVSKVDVWTVIVAVVAESEDRVSADVVDEGGIEVGNVLEASTVVRSEDGNAVLEGSTHE